MAGERPALSLVALSLALGAIVAELEDDKHPRLVAKAQRRLENEADRSMVFGLHGEHETDAERLGHADAIAYLRRLRGVVEKQRTGKGSKRKRA